MTSGKKRALVLGGGGFIGSHMVRRLKSENYWVRAVDLKKPEYSDSAADEFIIGDLTDINIVRNVLSLSESEFCEIYQYAADMGGAGFIFTGDNDAQIMHNSGLININVLSEIAKLKINTNFSPRVFYSSSACIYPEQNQLDPDNPNCEEASAYPANPDSEYGWEKLFSERLYFAYARNFEINVAVARFHNIFGPEGTWNGGREKSPAAICRKIAEISGNEGEIEVWGDGKQTRSFLFIDECIEATRRLMFTDFHGPLNIGSEEMVSLSRMVEIVAELAGKKISKKYKLDAPTGVRGRNSNNVLMRKHLNWDYSMRLADGLLLTYLWINTQVNQINSKY